MVNRMQLNLCRPGYKAYTLPKTWLQMGKIDFVHLSDAFSSFVLRRWTC